MSSFIQGMDNLRANKLIPGENGTLEYISTSDAMVDLFFKLMRGMSASDLESKVRAALYSATSLKSGEKADDTTLVDLFVMCMQTRDCRGGKGERDIFFEFFLLLAEYFPVTTCALIPLISHYGSYKDYFKILERINAMTAGSEESVATVLNRVKISILEFVANRLQIDQSLLEKVKSMEEESEEDKLEVRKSISLCAKYCPREGHSFWSKDKGGNTECMNTLLKILYPNSAIKIRKQLYRKLCSSICTFQDVTEQKMCGKRFADIVFKKVPSICTKKQAKAFLNEKLRDRAMRHTDDPDRVMCREHFIEHIRSGNVKGGQIFPHEIVKKIMEDTRKMSTMEEELMKGQWESMKKTLSKQIDEAMQGKANGENMEIEKKQGAIIDLGKLVALSDVSGSMSGTPMMVSIALGILISEMASPAFRNRVLTFESEPRWHNLLEGWGIVEKTKSLQNARWGGSTNLEAALDRIIDVCEANKLRPEDIPDLIIFSDMQFDEADKDVRGRKKEEDRYTQHERIVKKFHDVGVKIYGKPYSAPRVIYWNLRSNTIGFPSEADTSNVQLLSGYSPSLFKAVVIGDGLEGEEVVTEETSEDGIVKVAVQKKNITPYDTLRKVLDDSRYDDVRTIVTGSQELTKF